MIMGLMFINNKCSWNRILVFLITDIYILITVS